MRSSATDQDVTQLLQHSAWIRRLARGLVRDETLADELVQETWVAALRAPPRPGEPARPWLGQVLRNVLRMRFRADGRRARREEAVAVEERTNDGEHLVEAVETQRFLAEELLALEEPYRLTLMLRYYEGLSSAEIAARQRVPAATVRGRLKQGLDRLRTRLDRKHGGRGAWLGALVPLSQGRHAAGVGALKGALVMKGIVQATLLVAVLGGGTLLMVGRRSHPPSTPASRSPSLAATTAANPPPSPAGAADSTLRMGAAPLPTKQPQMRLDLQARTEMLRRLEEARRRAPAAAEATAAGNEQPLDKDYIRQQIRALIPQVSECYNNALRRTPALEGKLVVDFSIVGDPSVGGLVGDSKINAELSTIADAEMRECVQETMYAAQFVPPKSGGEVQVTYPFVFKVSND